MPRARLRAGAWTALAVILCAWAGAALAQPAGGASAPARRPGRLPAYAPEAAQSLRPLAPWQREERRFLRDAAAALRLQGEAARLARQRAGDPAVRELAAAVLREHRERELELLRLLHARGMAPPMPDNAQARTLKALSRADGRRFDQLYLEQVALRPRAAEIADHERMLAAAGDPALRQWIERQLPAMRHQLVLAGRAMPRGAARTGATRSMGAARQPAAR